MHFFRAYEIFLLQLSLQFGSSDIAGSQHAPHELPSDVAIVLKHDSAVTSIDFHPDQLIVLLGQKIGFHSFFPFFTKEGFFFFEEFI